MKRGRSSRTDHRREAISTWQQALFETAQRQGLLDEEKQKREWVTRHDEKVARSAIRSMELSANIDQSFEAEDGSILFQPPAHPRCRCSIRLVTGQDSEAGQLGGKRLEPAGAAVEAFLSELRRMATGPVSATCRSRATSPGFLVRATATGKERRGERLRAGTDR